MAAKNKVKASSNIFTAIVALAAGIVIASAGFIAYTCHAYYGVIFKIAEVSRY